MMTTREWEVSPEEIRRRAEVLRAQAWDIEHTHQASAGEDWLILEMRLANDTDDPAGHLRRWADEYDAAADRLEAEAAP